jgi:hypothetical protein
MCTTPHNAICTVVVLPPGTVRSGRKRVCVPPVTRESTGIGQTGSHDRGIMHAEARSDFPFKRTTARRSRSWLA